MVYDGAERDNKGRQNRSDRIESLQNVAALDFLRSKVAVGAGRPYQAMLFARLSAKGYCQVWGMLERCTNTDRMEAMTILTSHNDSMANNFAEMTLSETSSCCSQKYLALQCASFWILVPRLVESLLHLSELFSHAGLYQDAEYYLNQTLKIVNAIRVPRLFSQVQVALAEHLFLYKDLHGCRRALSQAQESVGDCSMDIAATRLVVRIAKVHANLGDQDLTVSLLAEVEKLSTRQKISGHEAQLRSKIDDTVTLEEQMSGMSIKGTASTCERQEQLKTSHPPSVAAKKQRTKVDEIGEDLPLVSSEEEIRQLRLAIEMKSGNLATAQTLLTEDEAGLTTSQVRSSLVCLTSELHFLLSLQELSTHPLFNIIPESTICHPALSIPKPGLVVKSPVRTTARSRKPESKRALSRSGNEKAHRPEDGFVKSLALTMENIIKVIPCALSELSTSKLSRMLQYLSKATLILTIFSSAQPAERTSSSMIAFAAGNLGVHILKVYRLIKLQN